MMTQTILQLSLAVPASTASTILQHWQALLPAASAQHSVRRLLSSLWQQQAQLICQHQQQTSAAAVLQIWQQQQHCWLLLSWQPEHCDLSLFWQQLAALPQQKLQPAQQTPAQPVLPVGDYACVVAGSRLTLARLNHQLQHSILQPLMLQHNFCQQGAQHPDGGQAALSLQQQKLSPAVDAALCNDQPTAMLALRLPLPAVLTGAELRIASVAQGLCLLDQPGRQHLLAGPLCTPLQLQAILAGLASAKLSEAVPAETTSAETVLTETAQSDTVPSGTEQSATKQTAATLTQPVFFATPVPCAVQVLFDQLPHSQLEWGGQPWSGPALTRLVARWQLLLQPLPAGAIVALDLARGPAQLAACLACLFSGCAFVPLDRQLPLTRLQQILQQLSPALVLTDREGVITIPSVPAMAQATMPTEQATMPAEPAANDAATPWLRAVSPAQLAYLMFTSGSTGTPKGVMLSRQALSTFLAGAATATGLTPQQQVLAHTSLGFDISLLELLLPLYCGARLRLLGELQNRALPAEPALLQQIDLLQGTPTLFRTLLAAGWLGGPQLTILAGGEALDADLVSQLKKRCRRLLHCYGPTEATVWSMMAETPDSPLLGPSLAGYRHQVWCSDGQPARCGMVGELMIQSSALADGYWQQSALSAQRFVHAADGGRWYHSGDLVRQLPDDRYQYLGRLDQQIKLRGHRIEPAEIEAVLRQHDAVQDCAVLFLQQPARLLACLAGDARQDKTVRDSLVRQLPAYMRPQLCWLDSLPMTASGKTDKQALLRTLAQQQALALAMTDPL
ncbi:MAG: AMP-binding protein [Rheinheimera sp.]|nr:AMP-binding protein [Rheinheimera sp.]